MLYEKGIKVSDEEIAIPERQTTFLSWRVELHDRPEAARRMMRLSGLRPLGSI